MKNVSVKSTNRKSAYIKGSKIPITYFLDYIKKGYSMSDFISAYPWVKREDIVKKLNEFENKEIIARYAF